VPAVVTNEDWNASFLSRFDQFQGTVDIIGDWLFEQHRETGLDGQQTVRIMQLVRRRNDYAIQPNCLQPSLKIREAGHPEGLCLLLRLRRRIDDGGQLCLGFFEDALDMSLSDHTRPGDGNANALHHTIPPLLVYHSGPSAHCAPPFHGSRVDDKKLRAAQAPTVASDQ
jgi:hypothetical protein